MVDVTYSVGFSLTIASLSLLGGFLGGMTLFCATQAINKNLTLEWRVISVIVGFGLFAMFFAIYYFESTEGAIYINYSRTLPENTPIHINLSCSNGTDCSAIIPNNLQISCSAQNCPECKQCSNQTVNITKEIYVPNNVCPSFISIPNLRRGSSLHGN